MNHEQLARALLRLYPAALVNATRPACGVVAKYLAPREVAVTLNHAIRT